MYIARQLSFAGTSFDIKEISLCDKFIDMYNASVKLVSILFFSLQLDRDSYKTTHYSNCRSRLLCNMASIDDLYA